MTPRRLFIAMALLTVPLQGFGFGSDQVGTSGAEFLKIGPGARPAGMGGAFTGVADDIHAIYWNPAGLGTLKTPEITGMHMQYFQSIQYEFAAFAYPTGEHGTWGFAVTNLHTDNIDRRTDDTDTAINQFGASDNAYWLSYGYALTPRLSLGANAKYIHQTLDSIDSNAYAGDGGILYDADWHDLRLGASVLNLGSKVKFVKESDPLPLTYRMGGSMPFLSRSLLLSSDLVVPRDHQVELDFGSEYKRPLMRGVAASMRAGYQTANDVTGFSGVSFGGGLEVGRAAFDFAWVPFGDLGNTYRFSLHVKFGQPDEKNLTDVPRAPQKQANAAAGGDASLEQLLSL